MSSEQLQTSNRPGSHSANVGRLKALQAQTAAELDALLPAILDQAFKGNL